MSTLSAPRSSLYTIPNPLIILVKHSPAMNKSAWVNYCFPYPTDLPYATKLNVTDSILLGASRLLGKRISNFADSRLCCRIKIFIIFFSLFWTNHSWVCAIKVFTKWYWVVILITALTQLLLNIFRWCVNLLSFMRLGIQILKVFLCQIILLGFWKMQVARKGYLKTF